jgi:hypothetical protein
MVLPQSHLWLLVVLLKELPVVAEEEMQVLAANNSSRQESCCNGGDSLEGMSTKSTDSGCENILSGYLCVVTTVLSQQELDLNSYHGDTFQYAKQ